MSAMKQASNEEGCINNWKYNQYFNCTDIYVTVLNNINKFLCFFKGEKILEKISNIKIIAEILEQVKKLKITCLYNLWSLVYKISASRYEYIIKVKSRHWK